MAWGFKWCLETRSVLFPPPPCLFFFFKRLCNSAQHCVGEISKSKTGWRKLAEARQKLAEAAERMGLAPALWNAEGLACKGWPWASTCSAAQWGITMPVWCQCRCHWNPQLSGNNTRASCWQDRAEVCGTNWSLSRASYRTMITS